MPRRGWLAALAASLVIAIPHPSRAQAARPPDGSVRIALAAGHTSAYQGGPTYLLSVLLPRSGALPIEFAAELMSASERGTAEAFWLGLGSREGWLGGALHLGARAGIVQGPYESEVLFDAHFSVEVEWNEIGLILQPAFVTGLVPFPRGRMRLVGGLTWTPAGSASSKHRGIRTVPTPRSGPPRHR